MSNDRNIMAKDREGKQKAYLGDGVYAVYNGFGIWLTTEDGVTATDAIFIEPAVLDALIRFSEAASKEGG